ncbi:MAG: imidazole glycerol phosphate synthase cyclase subunit [Brevundimonas sp.]|nr:MAG: imidazole glycerol phosphate synthase cyclase subunit [Brevundimonas sp.]
MLKKRVIPILLYANGRLVKTARFDLDAARDVGDPVKSVAVYNSQLADEIVLLNIEREARGWRALAPLVESVAKVCFTPLTIGGGVVTFEDAAALISSGADKVVINSAAYQDKRLITQVAEHFGAQAVIVGIDVRRGEAGRPVLFSDCGMTIEPVDLDQHIRSVVAAGAGEILMQSIDRDGMMQGYDVDLLATASQIATVPTIGAGGSGTYDHLLRAFTEGGVAAVACASIFHFSDSNPLRAKAFLTNHGLHFKVV